MIKNQNYSTNNFNKEEETLNLRAEIEKYLHHWKWFVLSIIVSMGISFLYLRYSTQNYRASSSILIKDNKKSGISAELAAFEDLGIIGGGSANNTDNEIEILKSRKIIGNVVDSLGLDVYYYISGRIKESEVYKSNSPIRLDFIKKDPILFYKDTAFNVRVLDNYKYDLTDKEGVVASSHTFGETISNEIGIFKIEKNNNMPNLNSENVVVKLYPRYLIIDSYRSRISISTVNKNSSVLSLSLRDPVREKAEDVLNELVKQYNIDAINDKNQVSEKTKDFISLRLQKVNSDLILIDDNVESFKISKDFTGLPAEAQVIFETFKGNREKIIEIEIQLNLAEWIEELLSKQSAKSDLLPSSLGFEDKSISQSIGEYNKLIIERDKIKKVAGPKNPALLQGEYEIESLKGNLLKSLSNVSNSLKRQLKEVKKEEVKVLSKIRSIPTNERGFIDIARQQDIVAGLYSYLLKKKEETDISLAVTVPNAKIIDEAYSSSIPVSPKRKMIYIVAILLGFIIPFVFLYIKDLLDTKVHNKQDVESELSVPFLGDIPKSESKEKIIIGSDVRSSTAEAFRLIRTNLDFMLASNRKQSKSIFITSTTSGEGKSFISINIAATLALSGKKVLLMGMDLRAPKVTEYLGIADRKGVTNYITDDDITIEEIIFNIPEVKGLDIISSGVIPPNPAELLMTKRVENLFTIVKQEYDIVIVDTAPVNLVTDTLLIAKYADMFMYVVRANYLDKRLLQVPQELYNEKKVPNMAIVLNDTDPKRSYGYGYGGYGYGYVVVEKPWYKKIFSKD